MRRKVVHTIVDYLAVVIIAITAVFLWSNKNYFAVPDSDIFQYIGDAQQYLQLKLPALIQMPPVNAILIGSLAQLLRPHMYAEILSAHIINIVAAIITMCLLYLLIRSYSRIVGALVLILLATNPLFIFQSLNVTSEVLFTTVVILSLLLYRNRHFGSAYVIAGCSFLIRYEGLLLLLSLIALDGLRHKNIHKAVQWGLPALIPVCLWLMVVNHNTAGSFIGNAYVQEIINFRQRIPQLQIVTRIPINLIDYVVWDTGWIVPSIGIILLYFLTLVGAFVLIRRRDATMRLVYLNASLYLVFHVFFPYTPDRYLYPVVWALYLAPLLGVHFLILTMPKRNSYLRRTCQAAGVLVIIFVAAGNLHKTIRYYFNEASDPAHFAFPRNNHLDVRLAADWLNNTTFEQPVLVFAYEPWNVSYYTNNRHVSFFDPPYKTYQLCESLECLVRSDPTYAATYRVIFIQQSTSLFVDSSFPSSTNLNVRIFNQFPNKEEKNDFILLAQLSKYDSWVKIYQFRPSK